MFLKKQKFVAMIMIDTFVPNTIASHRQIFSEIDNSAGLARCDSTQMHIILYAKFHEIEFVEFI